LIWRLILEGDPQAQPDENDPHKPKQGTRTLRELAESNFFNFKRSTDQGDQQENGTEGKGNYAQPNEVTHRG
jgi:hypothetical protein